MQTHLYPNYPNSLPHLLQQQQDQIQAILRQTTVSDPKYTDTQIDHLINPQTNKTRPSLKHSIHSANSQNEDYCFQSRENSLGFEHIKLPSRQSSESDQSDHWSDGLGIDQDNLLQENSPESDINQIFLAQLNKAPDSQSLKPQQRFEQMKSCKGFPYATIYRQIQQLQLSFTVEQVQKEYPSFLISKPSYKLESTVRQKKSAFNFSSMKSPFTMIDIGSSSNNRFYLAGSMSSHSVIVHELYSTKPYQIVQVFKPGHRIKSLKWSSSLQYMMVSNQTTQVKLFQFGQLAQSGDSEQKVKWLRTPMEVWSLIYPKIKTNIIDGHFISQDPVKVLLIDQEYEIYIVEMKKQFLSMKPSVTKLPIQFSPFLEMKLIKLANTKHTYGTLMVVGGQDYVTFAILEPKFEIVLVYDKQKHFPQAKRGGYPNILFVANDGDQIAPEIMIVWDKHMEVIRLKIEQFQPFTYKFNTLLKYTFPDSSLIVGNLSNTLIYQLTRLELKVYSLNQISKFNQNANQHSDSLQKKQIKFAEPIHSRKIDFDQFPSGQRLQELISNPVLQLEDLVTLRNLFSVSMNTLFICFEDCLYALSIEPFPAYIQTTIEAINDWKVGLQLINDGITKQITQFDQMNERVLRKQLKEYSSRYIEFLKGVIPDTTVNNEIWKQQMCFLFNILITSTEQKYLIKEILIKLYRVSPQLLKIYEPFILMGQLTQIDVDTLDLLLSVVDRNAGRRMIYAIRNSVSTAEDQHELAHLINNILIRYGMDLELIWVNQLFGDFYTPFVILLSKYERNCGMKENEAIEQWEKDYEKEHKIQPQKDLVEEKLQKFRQEKSGLALILSYLCFDTFRLINLSEYHRFLADEEQFHISKVKAKYLIETLGPIMQSKLNKILIENCAEQFFDYVMEEICYGNSLNVLQELNSGHNLTLQNSFASEMVEHLPYKTIVEVKQQGKYWQFILRLMIRKIIERKVIPGVYYLTLQQPQQSASLSLLIDCFIRQCSQHVRQELHWMQNDEKVELFLKLKESQNQSGGSGMELLRVVGEQLNREIQVLECMIESKPCHKVQLIAYMRTIISKACQTSEQHHTSALSRIKHLLKQNIKLFTSIDPEQTSHFIICNFKSSLKEFISYLEETPKEQLNLLKEILSHYNYGQFLNNEKRKYLELLAINGLKDQILLQIQQHMFPLDDAIDICKKYEILDAWAYLLVKSGGTGNSTLAIEIYFRIIHQHLDNYKYNRKSYDKQILLQNSMLNQLSKAIDVCLELHINGAHQEQTEWFFIIQQLELLKKHLYKTCSPDVEATVTQIIFATLYPHLVKQLLDKVPSHVILNYLQKSLSQLTSQTSELIIQEMVKSCSHQKRILKNAQHQIAQSEIIQRKNLLTQTLRGFITSNRCYECAKKDVHTKIHYSCGHDIHPECNQDVKECISCKNSQEAMFWRQVHLKDKVQKVIFYNPPDPNKEKTQSEMIRLSRQEKLKKFDELVENRVVILQ